MSLDPPEELFMVLHVIFMPLAALTTSPTHWFPTAISMKICIPRKISCYTVCMTQHAFIPWSDHPALGRSSCMVQRWPGYSLQWWLCWWHGGRSWTGRWCVLAAAGRPQQTCNPCSLLRMQNLKQDHKESCERLRVSVGLMYYHVLRLGICIHTCTLVILILTWTLIFDYSCKKNVSC